MGGDALVLDGVRAGYGAAAVLRGISAQLEPGRIVAIIGPNGAGKSTLLRVCMGLLPPTDGTVRLGSADLYELTAAQRGRRLAMVPQNVRWAFPFSVQEVVLMGRHPHQGGLGFATEQDTAIADAAMRDTGVYDLRARPVDSLSGGEGQRVALAAALAQTPDVLLLDEPTANLDLGHEAALRTVIRRLRDERGLSALIAMHDLSLAAALADELWLLDDGVLLARGAPAEVLDPDVLGRVYGVPIEVQDGPGSHRVLPLWSDT
jgi:iron complex transport system ATP-binding protein